MLDRPADDPRRCLAARYRAIKGALAVVYPPERKSSVAHGGEAPLRHPQAGGIGRRSGHPGGEGDDWAGGDGEPLLTS
jgi:hypothetical protein